MNMVQKKILLGNGGVKPEMWQTNERGAFPVIIGARYGTSSELDQLVSRYSWNKIKI
jgi:hypothetical protein